MAMMMFVMGLTLIVIGHDKSSEGDGYSKDKVMVSL